MSAIPTIEAENHISGHKAKRGAVDRTLTAAIDAVDDLIAHRRRNDLAVNAMREAHGDVYAQDLANFLQHEDALMRWLAARLSGTELGRLLYAPQAQQHYSRYHRSI